MVVRRLFVFGTAKGDGELVFILQMSVCDAGVAVFGKLLA
ncbi:MAG: hypothetical protein ACI9G1_001965, partial [Pirellulaceae bacterium]